MALFDMYTTLCWYTYTMSEMLQPEYVKTFEPMSRVRRSTGGVDLSSNDFENMGLAPKNTQIYNRSLLDYVQAINGNIRHDESQFRIEDWKGKRLLDLGSGAYEAFGVNARKDGVSVVSVNPALAFEDHRNLLLNDNRMRPDERKMTLGRRAMRLARSIAHNIQPGDMTVAAEAKNLPFGDQSFDGVVSVYAVPHYLYPMVEAYTDADKLQAYTLERREESIEEIGQAISEIVRVLRPGGRAYLVDNHILPGQTKGITTYSAPDGSELVEVLARMTGVHYQIFEAVAVLAQNQDSTVCRTTVLTKV